MRLTADRFPGMVEAIKDQFRGIDERTVQIEEDGPAFSHRYLAIAGKHPPQRHRKIPRTLPLLEVRAIVAPANTESALWHGYHLCMAVSSEPTVTNLKQSLRQCQLMRQSSALYRPAVKIAHVKAFAQLYLV